MSETPNDDQPDCVAVERDHCCACFRLIRSGQTNYVTLENEIGIALV